MERRELLKLLGLGVGLGAIAAPAEALPLFVPTSDSRVSDPEGMAEAQVEKAYYGHWRRVGRRHVRRVSRRVYRRRYY